MYFLLHHHLELNGFLTYNNGEQFLYFVLYWLHIIVNVYYVAVFPGQDSANAESSAFIVLQKLIFLLKTTTTTKITSVCCPSCQCRAAAAHVGIHTSNSLSFFLCLPMLHVFFF